MEQILFEFAYFLLSQQLFSFFTAQAAKTTSDGSTNRPKGMIYIIIEKQLAFP